MNSEVHKVLQTILDSVGWAEAPLSSLKVREGETALAGPAPVADIATAAHGALGLAAAELHRRESGQSQQVFVDRRGASLAMASSSYLRVDGRAIRDGDPITGYYHTGDGKWVFLHANFEHLRNGLVQLLDATSDRASVAERLQEWTADEVEREAGLRGLCAVKRRTRLEWKAHPQSAAVNEAAVVSISRLGDSPPEPAPAGHRPLDGLRVLDLTRVIAGPMAGRALAENGATVLRVNAPHLPYMPGKSIDTGFGKLSAYIDLRNGEGCNRFADLAHEADIFIDGYRPGALAFRGFSDGDLAELRPGIIVVAISAFSTRGPWGGRRGYDSMLQAAAGFTTLPPNGSPPRRLPCQPLDYLTGCLAAFGAMVALRRRAEEGGSWKVELSLARTASWLWQMFDHLQPEPSPRLENLEACDAGAYYWDMPSSFGQVRAIRPPVELSLTPARWDRAPVTIGSDPPIWPQVISRDRRRTAQ